MKKQTRIVFVHGNGTLHWSQSWAPWLKEKLEEVGYTTFFETMPDSILARSKFWLPFLKEHVQVSESDVLVGWSSGAVCAMRYAEENKIGGSVLIAPCYTDLNDEMEKQSGYFDKEWKWKEIKENQKKIALVYSDNDPFIPKKEFEHINDVLNPEVINFKDRKHFIDEKEFVEVLEYIKNNFN